jgi:uncharacterized protein YbbC (DUF1343 family)/CubicO group peptidase (beta-lactamase class C family)
MKNPVTPNPGLVHLLLSTFAALSAAVTAAQSSAQVFFPERLAEMDAAIREAIADQKCPGGVLWLERNGQSYQRAFGNRTIEPARAAMTEDTIFDAASLTKVVATTPAIMLLVERGGVDLDAPVHHYLPEFKANGKEAITIRHLMTHTSGLKPGIPAKPDWTGYEKAIELACAEEPLNAAGALFRYSDINYILLGEVVQRVSGIMLHHFVAEEVHVPLKMLDTSFLPPSSKLARVAPTEKLESGEVLHGKVHDPTARRMGGVAGHAGLFTTAADLARFARMLLNLGELDGAHVFKPETVKLMTSVQSPENVPTRRGLGWDIDSGYSGPRGKVFPIGSYGHTGWTGTSLWIDPFSRTFVSFLSNRNHPTEAGNVIGLRAKLGTLAAEAVVDFNFAYVPGALAARAAEPSRPVETTQSAKPLKQARVLNGIDGLVKNEFAPLKGKRIGLITNHTGHDRERNPTIDLLKGAPGVTLVALFSPEHGIRGAVDEKFGDSTDEKTGLPVFSLYGETRKPKPEHLKNLDALVFDIQDIGCRFYTYPSTMGLAMEAAAENGKPIFVLDRVNPINGVTLDGPVLTEDTSFVGFHPVPLRHGMTVGELAKMYNAEKNYQADLTVIPLEGWTRDAWFDQTGLPWTNPSPNMRNLKQAILYPGIGLLESAMSVGRGTDTPFEVVGAPYIEEVRFAEELNRAGLPGVSFVPVRFTPTYSVHKGTNCGGVYIMLNDRNACNVVDAGLLIAKTLHRWYPRQFNADRIKHLLMHARTLDAVKADKSLADIRAAWRIDLEEFQKRREKYLLYR